MTTEDQLRHIIEAQVKGGAPLYRNNGDGFRSDLRYWCEYHILEILLDPAGLKAAYGDKVVCEECLNRVEKRCHCEVYDGCPPDVEHMHLIVAHRILETWLFSKGDAVKTIQTAFSLLP